MIATPVPIHSRIGIFGRIVEAVDIAGVHINITDIQITGDTVVIIGIQNRRGDCKATLHLFNPAVHIGIGDPGFVHQISDFSCTAVISDFIRNEAAVAQNRHMGAVRKDIFPRQKP